MITLVKHHVTAAGTSPAAKEDFPDIDSALVKYHKYLSDYAADKTVLRADVVLLNDSLIPCEQKHYAREIPVEATPEEVTA